MLSSDAFEVDVCSSCGLIGYSGWSVDLSVSPVPCLALTQYCCRLCCGAVRWGGGLQNLLTLIQPYWLTGRKTPS